MDSPTIPATTSTPTDRDEFDRPTGKGPVSDPSILLGDLWPDDEPIEEFLAALHEWRGHNRSDRAALKRRRCRYRRGFFFCSRVIRSPTNTFRTSPAGLFSFHS